MPCANTAIACEDTALTSLGNIILESDIRLNSEIDDTTPGWCPHPGLCWVLG